MTAAVIYQLVRLKEFWAAAYNDRKRIIEVLAAWVKGFGFVAVCITVSRDVISNCIHIMLTGIADQAIHKYACDTD